MGKPYALEIQQLGSTYQWAVVASVAALSEELASVAATPLLTVGSGGSFTASHFVAAVHESFTGKLARAATPLEVVSGTKILHELTVMFLSAGGKNPDIIGAFKQTVHGEWVHLLCAIWIPETRVANEVFMEPITGVERISKQRWKLVRLELHFSLHLSSHS